MSNNYLGENKHFSIVALSLVYSVWSMKNKWKKALYIGRFQPFHNGHLYSLRKTARSADEVIIGIGSSNKSEEQDNPLRDETREEMLREVLKEEGLDNVVKIVGLRDFPSDEDWLKELVRLVGEFDVVTGNNDWTNGILKNAGYDVYETGLYNRDELEGVKIRDMIRKEDLGWQERVPEYLIPKIQESIDVFLD